MAIPRRAIAWQTPFSIPEGSYDNSPAIHRWVLGNVVAQSPVGTTERTALPAPKTAALTPQTVVARLQSRFDQIQDYECLLRTETRVGKKVEAGAFRLWYRRPGLLRLRVLHGRRKGSELLLRADGTLRGRRGGWLRAFPRRLRRTDRSLYSLRGHPAWELDFGSFLRTMRKRLEMPDSTAQVRPPTPAEPHLLLIVNYRPQGAARPLKDVWKIDSNRWLLLSGDVFDGQTRVDHVEFADLKVDQGLSELWFRF